MIGTEPPGNGRHAPALSNVEGRLMADLMMIHLGKPLPTCGRINLTAPGEARAKYIDALHTADQHELQPLIDFAGA